MQQNFFHTKGGSKAFLEYILQKKSTSTNTVFCDFIKRCFQDSQASGCRCYKPYNKKQNTEWDGGKPFPITILLPETLNEQTGSKFSN